MSENSFEELQQESRQWSLFHAGEFLGIMSNAKRSLGDCILKTPSGTARNMLCDVQIRMVALMDEFNAAVQRMRVEYENPDAPSSPEEASQHLRKKVLPHENPSTNKEWAENIDAQAKYMKTKFGMDYKDVVHSTLSYYKDSGKIVGLEMESQVCVHLDELAANTNEDNNDNAS